MKRPGVMVIAVLGALLVGLLVYGVAAREDDRSLEAAIDGGERPMAPDRSLPLLEGAGERSLADYRGKIVVLNFWASWCPPCRREIPLLTEFQEKLGERGTVLGVTYKDEPSDSRSFAKRFGINYPSLRDNRLELAPEYGTTALPETFVIDARGRIVAVSRGEVTQEFLDNALQRAEQA